MGFLQRLFGLEKPQDTQAAINAQPAPQADGSTIPPERVGLNGEYDESGLAKRVALAFDEDSELQSLENLYVAQLTGMVVLKGKVPSQELLNKAVQVAQGVNGATGVTTDEVEVG